MLFVSGACALVYQTVWLREMRLVFGASTAATAAVLGIFMGGLGLGGWLLGRKVDEHRCPLLLYSTLEFGICLSAAATPAALAIIRGIYLATGGSDTLGAWGAAVVRLLLAAVVLGLPAVLMGGTLPAAARAITWRDDLGRSRVALLFGFNTLGAVSGVLLSTFVLLEAWGNRRTLWLACLLNLLVALIARLWARGAPEIEPAPVPVPGGSESQGVPPRPQPGIAALAGFIFMLMELVWYRMLSPLLGGSTYTFGVILALALAGIGLGSGAFSRWGARRPVTLRALALTCTLEALFLALPLLLGDRLAILAAFLRPLGVLGFGSLVSVWVVIAGLVVFPTALVAGFQFPLLIALLGKGDAQVGRQVGLAYAWNTAGAILGSLLGGFVLLPALTAVGAWRLAGILSAGTGLWAALRWGFGSRNWRAASLPLAIGVAAILATLAAGPTAIWRHAAIGAGRFPVGPHISQLFVARVWRLCEIKALSRLTTSMCFSTPARDRVVRPGGGCAGLPDHRARAGAPKPGRRAQTAGRVAQPLPQLRFRDSAAARAPGGVPRDGFQGDLPGGVVRLRAPCRLAAWPPGAAGRVLPRKRLAAPPRRASRPGPVRAQRGAGLSARSRRQRAWFGCGDARRAARCRHRILSRARRGSRTSPAAGRSTTTG